MDWAIYSCFFLSFHREYAIKVIIPGSKIPNTMEGYMELWGTIILVALIMLLAWRPNYFVVVMVIIGIVASFIISGFILGVLAISFFTFPKEWADKLESVGDKITFRLFYSRSLRFKILRQKVERKRLREELDKGIGNFGRATRISRRGEEIRNMMWQ